MHTNAAQHFMKMAAEYAPAVHARFQAAASDDSSSTERSITVYDDEGEWRSYQHVHKDPVLHIQVRLLLHCEWIWFHASCADPPPALPLSPLRLCSCAIGRTSWS